MAVKNLQNLVQCVANIGVRVTGTKSKDSMRAMESFQAPFLSLLSLPLAGPFPAGTTPDNQGVLRVGRSACMLGVSPFARTMRETWSLSPSASYHREQKAIYEPAILAIG
jgi:hypothetical protein